MTTSASAARALLALSLALSALPSCRRAETPPATSASVADDASAPAVKIDAAGAPIAKLEHPFLWRVESPEGRVSHLFGTFHLGIDAEKQLGPEVWTPLGDAKIFVMEADLNDVDALQMVMRTDGTTLADDLGDAHFAELEKHLGAGMAAGLMTMKPSAVAAFLMVKALPMTAPMDMVLMNKAKAAGMEIVYLEELADQQKILDEEMDAEYLKNYLDHYDEMSALTLEAYEAYKKGDAEVLMALMAKEAPWEEDAAEKKASEETLLYRRNEAWIPKLKESFAKGDVFVAVGAGHLPGERGVVELLQKEGFAVERVAPPEGKGAAPAEEPTPAP